MTRTQRAHTFAEIAQLRAMWRRSDDDYRRFPIRACTVPGCWHFTNGQSPCAWHKNQGWR